MRLTWDINRVPLKKRPCFFAPDQISEFKHDAKDEENMIVLTAKLEPVCGRVIDGATKTWVHILDEYWIFQE